MIDVNKQLSQASASKGKKVERSANNLHNEIKIITSSNETFELWSELISNYAQGELIDPDTCKKFRENKNWAPQKDGILSREFFKWLGNLTEVDHRDLCKHMLMKSGGTRRYAYPKVSMKVASSVLPSNYSAREWVERRKRKHLLRRELMKIKPSLGLLDREGIFVKGKWRKFKLDFYVSKATVNLLLEEPGDEFYGPAKQTSGKNKNTEELSPYAKEFFKAFLRHKAEFVPSTGKSFYRSYDVSKNKIGFWPPRDWEEHKNDLKLMVIDFRNIPGFTQAKKSIVDSPYFEEFMQTFERQDQPSMTDPPIHMWIAGYKDAEILVKAYANLPRFRDVYDISYSEYEPSKFERLQDVSVTNKLAKEPVFLLFLVKKDISGRYSVPSQFMYPETSIFTKPRRYDELEYRIYSSELRMEFYLNVLRIFCGAVDMVVTLFAGTKMMCAAMVRS